jgi:hypothetical protein
MLIVWNQILLAALCQQKALFFIKFLLPCQRSRLLGMDAGNKLRIDKRKWLRFDEESTFS